VGGDDRIQATAAVCFGQGGVTALIRAKHQRETRAYLDRRISEAKAEARSDACPSVTSPAASLAAREGPFVFTEAS
jgi:hypothetical protein